MNDARLAYCAGIVDGEGCIFIGRHRSKVKGRADNYCLTLRVAMCHEATIKRLAQVVGIGTVYNGKGKAALVKRPLWIWHASSANAAAALSTLLPYLLAKRPEADLALSFAQLPMTPHGGGVRVDPALEKARESHWLAMRALKITSKNYFSERDNELARNVL